MDVSGMQQHVWIQAVDIQHGAMLGRNSDWGMETAAFRQRSVQPFHLFLYSNCLLCHKVGIDSATGRCLNLAVALQGSSRVV